MKRPTLGGSTGSSKTTMDEQIEEAVVDAIKNSNDKIIEIRPANESNGRGTFPLLLLIGGALAASYWLRKAQDPTEEFQSTASQTADRTKNVTKQAAETIREGGETIAERIEETSQKAGEQIQQTGESTAQRVEEESNKAGEQVQQTGEETAEKAEETGEKAAEKTEETGEKAAEKTDESDSDSSGDSSSS